MVSLRLPHRSPRTGAPRADRSTLALSEVALLLVAAFLLLEEAGPLSHPLSLAIGLIPLGILVSWAFPRSSTEWRNPATWIALAGCAISVLLLRLGIWYRPLVFAVFVWAYAGLRMAGGSDTDRLRSLALAVSGACLLILPFTIIDSAWFALREVSVAISRAAEWVSGRSVSAGPSYLGLRFAAFLLFSVVLFRLTERCRRPLDYVLPVLGVAASLLVGAVALAWLPLLFEPAASASAQLIPRSAVSAAVWERSVALWPLLSFLFLIPNLMWFRARSVSERRAARSRSRSIRIVLATSTIILLIAAVVVPLDMRSNGAPSEGSVLLYGEGYLNWLRPQHGTYGEYSGGMFGMLPIFLSRVGLNARVVTELTDSDLAAADALVLINIRREIPQPQLDAVWRFVRAGGSLLVVGDHTFRQEDGINWLNEVLEPSNIRFEFDSADFFIGGWRHSYEYRAHPLVHGMRDSHNQPGIVVGASLSVEPPAVPVIVGRYGYSDWGEAARDTTGYLGNLTVDPGEHLGDLVLAAEQRMGAGRVLVFGDTSGFTNMIALRAHRFVARVFRWLVTAPASGARAWREALGLMCLVVAVVGLVRMRASGLVMLVALVLAFAVPDIGLRARARRLRALPTGRIAYVDESHAERFSREGWRKNGVVGLHLNLIRGGYVALALDPFETDRLRLADLLVIIAPARAFDAREREAIGEYVSGGGRLLLSVGYEEKGPLEPLLSQFGLDVLDVPLGSAHVDVGDGGIAVFTEAWPVSARDGQYLISDGEYPLVAYKEIGKGSLVLVGDSRFLLNANLEERERAHEHSVAFFRRLLDNYLGAPGPFEEPRVEEWSASD